MSTSQTRPDLGTLGNYQLVEEIARGSFGTVYKARHWKTQDLVAIKAVSPTIAGNEKLLKRFQQEYQMMSKIDHPNVVRVLEYNCAENRPFLVMDYVDGISLGEKVEREGWIDEDEAIRICVQACQGLEEIHNLGLLHRDVKPDNILLASDGVVKMVDLGLAKELDARLELTQTGTGLGTPNFIAPEQFKDAKNADRRCDIYGLGASIYQAVTGVLPFADTDPIKILMRKVKNDLVPPQKINPSLSDRVVEVLAKAMSIEPEKRYATCWEMVDALVDTNKGLGKEFDAQSAKFDVWYIQFFKKKRGWCRATGPAEAIRDGLSKKVLGDTTKAKVSRTMAGPFVALDQVPQFVELLPDSHWLAKSSGSTSSSSATLGTSKGKHSSASNSSRGSHTETDKSRPASSNATSAISRKSDQAGSQAESIAHSKNAFEQARSRLLAARMAESNTSESAASATKSGASFPSSNHLSSDTEETMPMWLSVIILGGIGAIALVIGRYVLGIF